MTTILNVILLIFCAYCLHSCYDNLMQMYEQRKMFKMLNEKKECLERMREEIKNLKK